MDTNSPRYDPSPGDRVYDTRAVDDPDADPNEAVVLLVRDQTASEATVGSTPLIEYGDNAAYTEPDDGVVEIAFTSDLDSYIPRWEAFETPAGMRDYAASWDIPLHQITYTYPSGRLEPVAADAEVPDTND